MRPLSFVLSLSDGGFDQLFEARKVVEPAIAALAAARVDDATVDRLDALVTRAEAVIENPRRSWSPTSSCTTIIREAAGNAILERFMESIHALGLACRRATGTDAVGARAGAKDHRAIVAALRGATTRRRRPTRCTIHLENVERTGAGS